MRRIYFSAFTRFPKRKRKLHFDKDFFQKNGLLLFLGIVLLAGMICGCLSARTADENLLHQLETLFLSDVSTRSVQPMGVTFTASMASSFLFVLAAVMMGLSAWGIALVPVIPFFRGFGLGVSSGYLYAAFGLKGVWFYLAVMLPGVLLSSVSILLSCREAMRFSLRFTSSSFSFKREGKEVPDLRLYFTRNGLSLAVSVAAALCDMVFTALFAGLFSF